MLVTFRTQPEAGGVVLPTPIQESMDYFAYFANRHSHGGFFMADFNKQTVTEAICFFSLQIGPFSYNKSSETGPIMTSADHTENYHHVGKKETPSRHASVGSGVKL